MKVGPFSVLRRACQECLPHSSSRQVRGGSQTGAQPPQLTHSEGWDQRKTQEGLEAPVPDSPKQASRLHPTEVPLILPLMVSASGIWGLPGHLIEETSCDIPKESDRKVEYAREVGQGPGGGPVANIAACYKHVTWFPFWFL